MVFCSLDNDPDQYKEYYGSMPWLSLGYNNPAVTKLKQILGIEGIPTFVMCNTDLVPVTAEGVEAVKASGAEGVPWLPNAVKDLNLEPDDINAKPCLVFFMDKCGCSDEVKEQKIETLLAEETRYGPVVDADGCVAGVLSLEAIAHALQLPASEARSGAELFSE